MKPSFTYVTEDHVFVYVRGVLVMKTYRRSSQPTWLFQTAPSQALPLPPPDPRCTCPAAGPTTWCEACEHCKGYP